MWIDAHHWAGAGLLRRWSLPKVCWGACGQLWRPPHMDSGSSRTGVEPSQAEGGASSRAPQGSPPDAQPGAEPRASNVRASHRSLGKPLLGRLAATVALLDSCEALRRASMFPKAPLSGFVGQGSRLLSPSLCILGDHKGRGSGTGYSTHACETCAECYDEGEGRGKSNNSCDDDGEDSDTKGVSKARILAALRKGHKHLRQSRMALDASVVLARAALCS